MPGPPQLAALREAIVATPERWQAVEGALARAKLALQRDSALARLPKGYDAEIAGAVADAVRLRSFVVSRKLSLRALQSPRLIDDIVAFTEAGRPLLEFGWSALAKAPRVM